VVTPWLIVHLLLFNVELEFRRQKGDGVVKRAEYPLAAPSAFQ